MKIELNEICENSKEHQFAMVQIAIAYQLYLLQEIRNLTIFTSTLASFKIRLPSGFRMEPIAKSPNRIEANLDIALTFAPSERRYSGLSNNGPISKFVVSSR